MTKKTLTISKETADYYTKLLSMTGDEIYNKYGLKRDEVYSETVRFDDERQTEIDIRLIICEGEAKPYTEAVMFQEGEEIGFTDPYDTFLGKWECEDDDGYGNIYCVEIVAEN